MTGGRAAGIAIVGAPAQHTEQKGRHGHQPDGRRDREYAYEHVISTDTLLITCSDMTIT
ncbi:hypothetical protein GCM10027612_73560 [Microbispora bryophytorum subsp. camponoti]